MTRAHTATTRQPTAAAISVRPIHNEADYEATLEEVAGLMSAEPDTPEADRLDVLATLVEAYEAKHYPIDPPDPIAAIRFRMEQQGLTAQDLEPFIGTRARVSEVLNRRRPLSLNMIRRLAEGLGVPAAVLIRPTGAPSAGEAARKTSQRGTSRKVTSHGGARKAVGKRGAGTASRGRAPTRSTKDGKGADRSPNKHFKHEHPVPA